MPNQASKRIREAADVTPEAPQEEAQAEVPAQQPGPDLTQAQSVPGPANPEGGPDAA